MVSKIEYKEHDDIITPALVDGSYYVKVPEYVAQFMALNEKSVFNLKYHKTEMVFIKRDQQWKPSPGAVAADKIENTNTNAVSDKNIRNNKHKPSVRKNPCHRVSRKII